MKEAILNNERIDIDQFTKDEFYIENSFMGLEFVLVKGLGDSLKHIFEGDGLICYVDFKSSEFTSLGIDEQFKIYESTPRESYISSPRIKEILELVKEVEPNKINQWYNPKELNDNGIYPEIWHDDNAENLVYNCRDLRSCFIEWKDFLEKVTNEGDDYIIVR